jgi:hypothetical protein
MSSAAAARHATPDAFVHDDEAIALVFDRDRPHRRATTFGAIAGMHIDMN